MKAVIRTFSGLYVNPLDLKPSDIRVEDIAHALACCNRFAGHLKRPISVAQHSVHVSKLCERFGLAVAYEALFHDASEAYLGDVTKWLKATAAMKGYRDAEERAQNVIYKALGLRKTVDQQHFRVTEADNLMVRFEGSRGFDKSWMPSGVPNPKYPPLTDAERELIGAAWRFQSWHQAEIGFHDQYLRLIRLADAVLTPGVTPRPGERALARRILTAHLEYISR